MTQISVVVPSWNTREALRTCLEALKSALPPSSEVLVVDNGSRDASARMVHEQFPWVRIVRNARNTGYAHACNQGAELARGAYVLFLHTDVQVATDTVRRLVQFLEENPKYGAATPRLLDPDGTTQRSHQRFPNLLTPLFQGTPLERWIPDNFELDRLSARDFDYERDGEVQYASGACLLMRRKALKSTRPMDESMWLYFADADLCKRLWSRGWRIAYLSQACALHAGGASTRFYLEAETEWQRNRLAYYRKHFGRWSGWWVKTCVAWTFADACVREFWRRAHGAVEEPLLPLWQDFELFLRR
ncbi:MAG: glycosyltransferase family 2 protein [Planctomycetes bacterium]|nr:glycosyltransferase family 2 protein [Planctomycetota bacterium]